MDIQYSEHWVNADRGHDFHPLTKFSTFPILLDLVVDQTLRPETGAEITCFEKYILKMCLLHILIALYVNYQLSNFL